MKRWLMLLMLVPFCLAAQNKDQQYIDSVIGVLPRAKEDTLKVELLYRLSFTYQFVDPDEGIKRGKEALTLSEKLGWKTGTARANNALGVNYKAKSDYPKALDCYYKALEVYESLSDKKGIAQVSGNLGILFKAQNDYESAMKYYQQALEVSKETGDERGVAINLGNIGILYNTQHLYGKALSYEQQALETWRKLKSRKSEALWLGNIAIIYSDSGEYALGLDYANQALAINTELENKKSMADNYRTIGSCFFGLAKDTLSKAVLNKQVALQQAKENLEKALDMATPFGDLRNLQEINELLSNVYELSGEHERALAHYRQYVMYKDSIFSMDSKEMIANLEANKEIELLNKEREQEQEKSRRATIYFLVGLGILLLISSLFFSRYRLKQRSNVQLQKALEELKETQQQLIQQEKLASLGQMAAGIAHEIQNPLNFVINFSSVSNELLAELETAQTEAEKTELLAMLKDNLAKIEHHGVRSDHIVKAMMMHGRTGDGEKVFADINTICEEMINLANYSNTLEHPGFACRIERSFAPAIPAVRVVPQDISKVLLNLLNNAFYAVLEKKSDAKVSVSTQRSGDMVLITIKDNGTGIIEADRGKIFQPFFTTKPAGEGTGLGLSISFDILKAHGGNIRLNKTSEEGTEFIVQLPVKG